jgi:proteasome-associated ATPase
MIENIVRRAKKLAIKRVIAGGDKGCVHPGPARLHQAGVQGARGPAEHHQPDDWAKISGKKGERIVFIRSLVNEGRDEGPTGGRSIERVQTGQYL